MPDRKYHGTIDGVGYWLTRRSYPRQHGMPQMFTWMTLHMPGEAGPNDADCVDVGDPWPVGRPKKADIIERGRQRIKDQREYNRCKTMTPEQIKADYAPRFEALGFVLDRVEPTSQWTVQPMHSPPTVVDGVKGASFFSLLAALRSCARRHKETAALAVAAALPILQASRACAQG